MKIYDLDPEIILKVNICCSDACPRKLEKYLMEISGVYTVVIDPDKSLITVRGKVDPMVVLNAIRKTGHSAELFSYKKEPKIEEDDEKYSRKDDEHVRRRTGREKTKHYQYSGMEDYVHKAENYIRPEVCLIKPFCKHYRRIPIVTNRVPLCESADHHHPHHAHEFLCYQVNPFDYHHHHPRIPLPPDACGLNLRRPVHGFSNFNMRCCF